MEEIIAITLNKPPIYITPEGLRGTDYDLDLLPEIREHRNGGFDIVYEGSPEPYPLTAREVEEYALGLLWMVKRQHGLRNQIVV